MLHYLQHNYVLKLIYGVVSHCAALLVCSSHIYLKFCKTYIIFVEYNLHFMVLYTLYEVGTHFIS